MMGERKMVVNGKKAPPSLIDLCVKTAIDNLRYLGDVGETDIDLLGRILPHCTLDQLMHVEKCSKGRDLSPVTNKLWKTFYEKQFGARDTNRVVERMAAKKLSFNWIQLYEVKLQAVAEDEKKAAARFNQLYKKVDEKKQSRQVQLCTKVPPSSKKRSFNGGSGPWYSGSNGKSNLMKKSKIDFLNSHEVKNLAAVKKQALQQRNRSTSTMMKPAGLSGKDSASSSRLSKPVERRF